MARSSIKPESDGPDLGAHTTGTALAERPSPEAGAAAAYDPGYYDDVSRDVEIPVLGLVNNVGNLAKEFRNQSGRFVLGEIILGEKVEVIPVAVVKYFAERVRNGKEIKHGSPEFATRRIFATAAEAAQFRVPEDGPGKGHGYVVDFENRAPNRIEEAGRIGYLVVAPDGTPADSTDFVLKPAGSDLRLALAKCSYQRGGFRGVFRPVFDHANKLALLKGLPTRGVTHSELFNRAQAWDGIWSLTAKECQGNDNFWFEPRIAKKAKLAPEIIAWVTENYGAVRA